VGPLFYEEAISMEWFQNLQTQFISVPEENERIDDFNILG
jgi:hypothetical protein